MVLLSRNELTTIWFDGIKKTATQDDLEWLQKNAPSRWGHTETVETIDEFAMLHTTTLWKYHLSVLIQDVLSAKAKKSSPYRCLFKGLAVEHLSQIAKVLKIEIPKKINGRALTNLILKKLIPD